MRLRDRHAIITGAGQGLGAAIAEAFVAEGASVLLCARTMDTLENVRNRLMARLAPNQRILLQAVDVAERAQVDALLATAVSQFPRIDVLVNNAGVYGPIGKLEEVQWEAWTQAIAINLLGTVYLCRAVVPHMKAQRSGKIVNLSGGGATGPLPRISVYAASKAAVVRFTETLAHELAEYGIDVNAIAPGALATRMLEEVLQAGPNRSGVGFYNQMVAIRNKGGTPLEKGAALAVYLASAASDGITGRLISAVWDPWTDLQNHADALRESDIYTLRRIVPKDRGQQWGEE